MNGKNRYFSRSKVSEAKFRPIVRYFALNLTATECAACSPLSGELEADESYFGPRRVRGKRGRSTRGQTIVFGLLKHTASNPLSPRGHAPVRSLRFSLQIYGTAALRASSRRSHTRAVAQ
jgi:hypothetical protein